MRQHDVERRAASRAAALEQGGLEKAAMLVGAFEIHHLVGAAVDLAMDAGEAGEMNGVLQHIGVGRAGIEPDVEDVVDLLVIGGIVVRREEAPRRALGVPGVGAFLFEGLGDARVDALVDQRRMLALLDEDRDRHAPGALPAHHPVRLGADHAADAVLARGRNPAGFADRGQRGLAQGRALVDAVADRVRFRFRFPRRRRRFAPDAVAARVSSRDRFVHRDEPLRRVAEDDRLFRAPGVRILVLEFSARDEIACRDQGFDHRLVGVALLALVVDDALAFEAGGVAVRAPFSSTV